MKEELKMALVASSFIIIPLIAFMILNEVFDFNIFCNSHWHAAIQCWNGGKGY